MTAVEVAARTINVLRTPEMLQDPYPFYRMLRERDPVLWDAERGHWVLTRHRDVLAVLRDRNLSCARRLTGQYDGWDLDALSLQMLSMDPPDHTRLRNLFRKAFTAKTVDRIRPRIVELTDELLDPVHDRGEMEVVADLALPLPVRVICELLGIPRQDHDLLRRWSASFGYLLDDVETDMGDAVGAVGEFLAYLGELVESRRRRPAEDLVSDLVHVQQDGDRLSTQELLVNLVLLLAAGHVTTAHMLSNGTLALLRYRDQWRALRAEPDLIPAAVMELLRFDAPVQLSNRYATTDFELAGKAIRPGDVLATMLGAANRDPDVFTDPDRLDLRRSTASQLAFGHGIHACIGMALARAEGEIAFGRLVSRFPHLHLVDGAPPVYEPSITFRALHTLHVRWD
jgi:cytochrome P450